MEVAAAGQRVPGHPLPPPACAHRHRRRRSTTLLNTATCSDATGKSRLGALTEESETAHRLFDNARLPPEAAAEAGGSGAAAADGAAAEAATADALESTAAGRAVAALGNALFFGGLAAASFFGYYTYKYDVDQVGAAEGAVRGGGLAGRRRWSAATRESRSLKSRAPRLQPGSRTEAAARQPSSRRRPAAEAPLAIRRCHRCSSRAAQLRLAPHARPPPQVERMVDETESNPDNAFPGSSVRSKQAAGASCSGGGGGGGSGRAAEPRSAAARAVAALSCLLAKESEPRPAPPPRPAPLRSSGCPPCAGTRASGGTGRAR